MMSRFGRSPVAEPSGDRRDRAWTSDARTGWLAAVAAAVAALAIFSVRADSAGQVSTQLDPSNGFPTWYQDSAGNRVEQCIDPNDANCVVLAGPTFDPLQPTVFPTNFPDEFFYALTDSEIVDTPGCLGTVPGKASVRLALEGAFLNGDPAPNEQMVFGRIRVRVSSGLCPNTTYQFRHPFGTETLTTNNAGAIPPNAGTEDIGCVPAPPSRCDFAAAGSSRVFGTAGAGGFLHWDPAVAPAAPPGYLGDAVTPHAITGGATGNAFRILDSLGNDTGLGTDLFTVAGKLAGSLAASPSPLDVGGQELGGTSAPATLTVTNLDSSAVTVGTIALGGADAASFDVPAATNGCAGRTLSHDETCTLGVTFSPTGLTGRRRATLTISSSGGIRTPLVVPVTGNATTVGAQPVVATSPGTLAFGDVRVRTLSPTQTVTLQNTGDAPLAVTDVAFDPNAGSESDNFLIFTDSCTGRFVDPGNACAVGLAFAPLVAGGHQTSLLVTSNASGSPHTVAITGNGTGGVAAVSSTTNPANGFTDWYRDEAGVKVSQCLDPNDPFCIVLGDDFFDPAKPLSFPDNFPSEFFYQVATSDNVATPGCNGSAPGRAFIRTAVEGTFANAGPAPGDQIVFGRIRIVVTGGLCPNTAYTFVHPYGEETLTTNAAGAIARNAGTEDIGCFPVAPATCDFSLALSSRVLGGLLRWDPAVAPAAPAGYLGDGATLHTVVGAPYRPDGVTPANYLRIVDPAGQVVGETDQFTVMGKLQGPLEPDPASVDFGVVQNGSTSGSRDVVFTNTGIAPIDVTAAAIGGVDASDFGIGGGYCAGAHLDVGASCTVAVQFTPTQDITGDRAAVLSVQHSGLNSPVNVPLSGVSGATGTNAAISFSPRSLTFAPLHVGRSSSVQTVSISNAGGNLPLDVIDVALGGPGAGSFAITDNRCTAPVDPGGTCQVDVAFTPRAAGAVNASLVVTDNAPGTTHTVALGGTGSNASPAVAAELDSRNGFPQWYQDSNGVRLEPCLDAADANCIVLADATFNPTQPLRFPANFPGEFFYTVADSNLIDTPGCGGTAPGKAFLRVAMEGSFANGTPAAGDQTTFGRIRVVVNSGLCPNVPYTFLTPYGTFQFTTNSGGGFGRNAGTQDIGCGAAPCSFADALVSPVADSFLRWDPNSGAPAPAGYLGDAVTFHKVVGGTYVPPGASQPVNAFAIADSAGNEVGRTDLFTVSGRIAGPLQANPWTVDFGHQPVTQTSGVRTVTLTNVGGSALSIASGDVTITGANAGEFQLASGGTCAGIGNLAADGTCTVRVVFAPTTTGTKGAQLRVTPSGGRTAVVALSGVGDPAPAPVASVSPGVLAYGTVVAGSSATLTTTVTNTGNADLTFTGGFQISGAAAVDFSVAAGTTCSTAAPVAPGASCLIAVRFSPTAIGTRTAALSIPHNVQGSPTVVSLTAAGAASTFVLSPSPVKFGTIDRGQRRTTTVTVRNSGTLSFKVTSATITGTQASAFGVTGTGCVGTILAPGKTCNQTVSFAPTQAINYTANLVVAGDQTTLPATVTTQLQGTGK